MPYQVECLTGDVDSVTLPKSGFLRVGVPLRRVQTSELQAELDDYYPGQFKMKYLKPKVKTKDPTKEAAKESTKEKEPAKPAAKAPSKPKPTATDGVSIDG